MEEKLRQITKNNCIKVVLFGPESTGKTTLAAELANYYDTIFVEEFSRQYAEKKASQNLKLTYNDVLPIAIGQMQLENEQLIKTDRLLICDTDLLETKVYSEYYFDGFCPDLVKKYALKNTYDLYFLTYIDTPWISDGIRDQYENRTAMFHAFEAALKASNRKYVVVKGSLEERFDICKTHIDNLLKI